VYVLAAAAMTGVFKNRLSEEQRGQTCKMQRQGLQQQQRRSPVQTGWMKASGRR